MTNHAAGRIGDKPATAQKLEALAWGLFFVWIGIALLTSVGWGIGLAGVGILILGGQAARKYLAFRLDTFWVAVGVLFVLGGVWELFGVRVSLVPVFCILAGVALMVSALVGKPGD